MNKDINLTKLSVINTTTPRPKTGISAATVAARMEELAEEQQRAESRIGHLKNDIRELENVVERTKREYKAWQAALAALKEAGVP